MRKYLATYQDKRGTEMIEIKSNGSEMFFTLRGIDFDGPDFDQLTANKIDDTKFDYEMFQDGSGDVTNFKLTITIPIQLFNTKTDKIFFLVLKDDLSNRYKVNINTIAIKDKKAPRLEVKNKQTT